MQKIEIFGSLAERTENTSEGKKRHNKESC